MNSREFYIRPVGDMDRAWIAGVIAEFNGSSRVVSRGRLHHPDRLAGFVAIMDSKPVGAVTYYIEGSQCEIVSLNSVVENAGIGTALITTVELEAASKGCRRVWLVTTNDNYRAFRFYQKRGFRLAAAYPDALEESRKLKPEIPEAGLDGIPLRDELEFELILGD